MSVLMEREFSTRMGCLEKNYNTDDALQCCDGLDTWRKWMRNKRLGSQFVDLE